MKQACLLTGKPGVGKTTLITEAVSRAERSVGGFYTREIRSRSTRKGFEIVTLDGNSAVLAHVDFDSPCRVSKYGVDQGNLDRLGVAALRHAVSECEIVIIDEIGKMELFSPAFRQAVMEAIGSGRRVLGTVMLASHPWADQIKKDPRVEIIEVSRANRDLVLHNLVEWIRG